MMLHKLKLFLFKFKYNIGRKRNKLFYLLTFPIITVGGLSYINERRYNDYIVDEYPKSLSATVYRIMPLTVISNWIGSLTRIQIPMELREKLLGQYVKMYQCDMSEASNPNLNSYKSLLDLFTRRLKVSARPIDHKCDLISPCDGTMLNCGVIKNETKVLEQVKGVKFTLAGFMGSDLTKKLFDNKNSNNIFYAIIYLSPGDCHRFHSPSEFLCEFRRYYPGTLMSVSPSLARRLPGLFSVNERAVYWGTWHYGYMSYSAIGATGVGNIVVPIDNTLPTNAEGQTKKPSALINGPTQIHPEVWDRKFAPAFRMHRGQLFGIFEMGSTIVLIFEAPSNFTFAIKPGQKVKMGSILGDIDVDSKLTASVKCEDIKYSE